MTNRAEVNIVHKPYFRFVFGLCIGLVLFTGLISISRYSISGEYKLSHDIRVFVSEFRNRIIGIQHQPPNSPADFPKHTASPRAKGPLRIDKANPRYFTDGSGRAILLVGDHTWYTFQDSGNTDPPKTLDYTAYLDFLQANHINFFRMFVFEQVKGSVLVDGNYYYSPMPYQRTGLGTALDGKPKFDLTKFNQAYFDRLRDRVSQAGARGIYVSIQLFEGFSVESKPFMAANNPWPGHPFNQNNNINGINGDPNGNGQGEETHTLQVAAVTSRQEAYVKKVIDSVNDLDNVLFEISNESNRDSGQWQYHMINYVKAYEATLPKQHPVGMTVEWPGGDNSELFASPADWISPNSSGGYYDDPPASIGSKVIINDTDHLCYPCGHEQWIWKSVLSGLNPAFMDPYDCTGDPSPSSCDPNDPIWVSLRLNLGYALSFIEQMNLDAMTPRGDLASSGYCLANPASNAAEYLVYLPSGGSVTVDLSGATGTLNVEWFNPNTGTSTRSGKTAGGATRSFTAPFSGDAVLYVSQSAGPAYPLKASANKRYLVDQNNVPFLIAGDSAQAMIGALSEAEADTYLANRAVSGINAIWTHILCHNPHYSGCRGDSATYDGIAPFSVANDLSTPNEAYFTRVDHMLQLAAKYGIVVFLDPIETINWLNVLLSNGTTKAFNYGVYLGDRYKDFPNIIWLHGNDFQTWSDPSHDAVVLAVANGIKSVDTKHLQTVELDYDTSGSLDDPAWAAMIGMDSAYSYYPQYHQVLTEYNRADVPVWFIEGVYEYQDYGGGYLGSYQLRNQEYWTQLSGSTGQLYGNANIFRFVAGWQNTDWQTSTGIRQFAYAGQFFAARRWYDLVPDQNHTTVTGGYGAYEDCCQNENSNYLTAARASDGSIVIAYLPTRRTISVDMTRLSGSATARWFDPTNAMYTSISGSPFANTGSRQFTPPGDNSDGEGDWVLVLEKGTVPTLKIYLPLVEKFKMP